MEFFIKRASVEDVHLVAPLFNEYRVFYDQASDEEGAGEYIKTRLTNNESVIFLACNEDKTESYGFTQLYPSFSSVSMKKVWILNDLFVASSARRNGIAKELMLAAHEFGKDTKAKGISLETAPDNHGAQQLYESLGYKKDEEYFHYFLTL
ncbi:GNAT family N-acetyltransferase [Bacillus luteolus]|uniref:GNAT family N-acetyltransferase n=1 Tax=Litchfieldia luteola TaxID=682179 RepID=A0ABR9QH42_9BACI|nr:GNAT family N-acetyltransferase [Cytobacillus luteolus]MBE4907802.1 GNAT family N-acetyltransferase [Cytobacillus luteolus]MBP1944041.1 ribosomal protein S18 acetylase RimI-like enzyme [Cytobacillus luteolus]